MSSTVACPAVQYFSTLSRKRRDFRKKKCYWTQNVCFDSSTTFVWNISHSKKNWARCNHNCMLVLIIKYLLVVSDFNRTWIFLGTDFREMLKYQILWKSVLWESKTIRLTRNIYLPFVCVSSASTNFIANSFLPNEVITSCLPPVGTHQCE
jgi:hypothetical protein